jgi:uncharacterized protein with FMN-binding domain
VRTRAVAVVVTLALAAGQAAAHARTLAKPKPKKKVVTVTQTFAGTREEVQRWGYVLVKIDVRKTTTTVGKRSTIVRRVVSVKAPIVPDETGRSQILSEDNIPTLCQEALRAQFTGRIDAVSYMTDTTDGFERSLNAALLKAQAH